MHLGVSRTRSASLLLISSALLGGSLHWALSPTAESGLTGPTTLTGPTGAFGPALVTAATWLLVVGCAWLTAIATSLALEAFQRRRPGTGWCAAPPALRRLVAVSSGAALSLALAPAALADAPATSPQHAALDGLRLPTRPVTASTSAATPGPDHHVVASGESLWSIVAERVPGADEPKTVELVSLLHHHNAAVIGSDPDVLRPGQSLRLPEALR